MASSRGIPTQSFFRREFRRHSLHMWHAPNNNANTIGSAISITSADVGGGAGIDSSSTPADYAHATFGLFPSPISQQSSPAKRREEQCDMFRFLGRFMAKALMDFRMVCVISDGYYYIIVNIVNINEYMKAGRVHEILAGRPGLGLPETST